jgi:dTMP kinase
MPYLIAIEGIDGAGKGTQAKMLVKNLQGLAMTVETMSFPAYEETEGAKLVARYLNGEFGDVAPELAAMMFAIDRFENRDQLKLNLESNDAVVLDRYVWSNIAHQTARLKYQPEIEEHWQRRHFHNWVQTIEFDVFKLPRPSVTVLVDIPVDLAIERIAKKTARLYTDKAADMHEADHSALRIAADAYRQMAVDHEWIVVSSVKADGTPKTVDEVATEILLKVLRAMGQQWRLDPQWEFNRVDIAKAIHQTWSQNPWDKSSEACRQDSLNSADVAIAEMIKQLSQKGA